MWVVMWCDVMSQLLSVLVTECTWTGQQTKGSPYIVPAWCPAQSWMTRTLNNVTFGVLTVVMMKSHYAVYAYIRNQNAGAAYRILLWGSPRWQQFAAPKHRYLYVNTCHHVSEEQMCLFCDCGHIKDHCLCRQPSHPCPSALIPNSKILCTAVTVANATSHFMVQLPQQSHTVCATASTWWQVWVK